MKYFFALFLSLVCACGSDNPKTPSAGDLDGDVDGGGDNDAPTVVDVSGSVVDMGGGAMTASVSLNGVTTTTTDADGHFVLHDVTLPYDVTIGSNGAFTVYRGVRSATPRLEMVSYLGHLQRDGAVSVELSGHDTVIDGIEEDQVDVCLDMEEAVRTQVARLGEGSFYRLEAMWSGESERAATVRGVRTVRFADAPVGEFVAFGELAVSLVDDTPLQDQALHFDSIGSSTTSGSVNLPAGYLLTSKTLSWGCLSVSVDATADAAFTLASPDAPPGALTLVTRASIVDGEVVTTQAGVTSGDTEISATVPVVPTFIGPPNATSNVVPSTTFAWSAVPDALYVLIVRWEDHALALVTESTFATVADLTSGTGFVLPANTTFTWQVYARLPDSLERFVTEGSLRFPDIHTEATLGPREFTTAP